MVFSGWLIRGLSFRCRLAINLRFPSPVSTAMPHPHFPKHLSPMPLPHTLLFTLRPLPEKNVVIFEVTVLYFRELRTCQI